MSRSGYSDDCDNVELWRGSVLRATRGRRGQKFFRDLLDALEALPEKVLIVEELIQDNGDVCAIGSLGKARGIDMSKIDPEDYDRVAETFDIAHCLAQEVAYMNDEYGERNETPEKRWVRMHAWVQNQIKPLHTNNG